MCQGLNFHKHLKSDNIIGSEELSFQTVTDLLGHAS